MFYLGLAIGYLVGWVMRKYRDLPITMINKVKRKLRFWK